MQKGIIYVRSKSGDSLQTWKQMLLLLGYAKEIDFQMLGIIAVAEDDNAHDRQSIEQLFKELNRHNCHAVLVMELECLSDDPIELEMIKRRFMDDGIIVLDLFDNK